MQVLVGSDVRFAVTVLSNFADSPSDSRFTDSSCFSGSVLKEGQKKKGGGVEIGKWKRGKSVG